MHSPLRLSATLIALGLMPFASCVCDDVLGQVPAPIAILVKGDDEAPPLEHLAIGLPATTLGATVRTDIVVRNDGNADLNVADVVLVANPDLCPAPSGAFQIVDPVATPHTFTVKRQTERVITVAFTPTSGQPSCTVVELRSNDKKNPALQALLTGQGDAAQLCTDRAVLDFGEVEVGTTVPDTVVVESCGTRPAAVGAISLNEQFPAPFTAQLPSTPRELAPGDRIEIPVTFHPTVAGQWSIAGGTSGGITLELDAGTQTYRIDLVGTANEPPRCAIQAVPAAVQFGSVGEGRESTQDVLVRNIGVLDCSLSSIAVVEPAGSFSRELVDLTETTTLAPGQGGTVRVRFAPTSAAGAESGILRIASSDPVQPTLDVPLQGASVEVAPCFLEAAPTAINFGFQPMLRTTEREVELVNVGTEDCVVSDIAVTTGSPPFSVIEPALTSLGDSIPPPFDQFFDGLFGVFVPSGESVRFIVSYRPETAAAHSGNVRFTYKETGTFGSADDQTLDVPTTGTGVAPCVQVLPQAIDFGAVGVGQNRVEQATIVNCGGADLVVRGVGIRAGSHPDYSVQNPVAQPSTIPPGGEQTVEIRAALTAAGQTAAGTAMYGFLDVLTDTAPATVSLRANADACVSGLQCVPANMAFGDVVVGDTEIRSVVCSNPGTTSVNVNATIAAPFEVVSAPATIAAGSSGVIRVRYAASNTQSHSATLNTGAFTCSGGPATVAVTARGVDDVLPACPTPANFTPQVTWEWEGGTTSPGSVQTWSTPLVARIADTNNDGVLSRDDMPRVLFISFDQDDAPDYLSSGGVSGSSEQVNDPVPGMLRAIAGNNGSEVWSAAGDNARLNSSVTPALVDLDGDGCVETIGSKYILLPGVADIPGGPEVNGKFAHGSLIAIDCRGNLKWESQEWVRETSEIEDAGGIAVGDMDGDGFAEVAVGSFVYDHNGQQRFRGLRGTGSAGHGPTSVLADVDGQAGLELIAGPTVYRADGSILWDRLDDIGDGHPSVADLDGNGTNEVVIRNRKLTVLNGQTGATIAGPRTPPTRMAMGAECESTPASGDEQQDDECGIIPTNPAIIDIDGDGQLDIAVSAQELLIAYRRDLSEIYRVEIFDGTGASGPVGFDFESDGTDNVVYADEDNVWSWGANGSTIYQAERQSVTMFEYATVADIDNDGHANIVVGSNEPQFNTADGLDAWENTGVSWAQARAMWNQHAYAEELIGELGTPNWVDGPMPLHGFRRTSGRCE